MRRMSDPPALLPFLVVGLCAFLVSGLTLFSGFGLGTLLMPVFALFFPVPVAVASTALVHVANNLFKLGLLRRNVRAQCWSHSEYPRCWPRSSAPPCSPRFRVNCRFEPGRWVEGSPRSLR